MKFKQRNKKGLILPVRLTGGSKMKMVAEKPPPDPMIGFI
jgi:hypothetical protein